MERIKLNLIPSGVAPIVHLSQYDDGRQFGIDLFEGESVYVLDGTETLTVNSRKPDGHVVTLTVTNTGTSSLDVDTVEQLTAVHGVSYAKLKIEKGSVTIATLPFLIDVSRDPLENGDPSESFIQNLATQIAEGVAEEVATQYDSSNVIFDEEPTENHGIGYTVTSEGIKTAIDNAFDYDNTASGSLVHITDGADNIPVKSLVSQIVAVESGNGQPKSPDNPYTISGFDSGVICQFGKNLYNKTTITTGKFITNTGTELSNTAGTYSDFIAIKTGVPYYFSHIVGIGAFYSVAVYDENKTFIEIKNISGSYDASNTLTFDKGAYIRVNVNINYVDTCQIEFGTSATDYTPFVASNNYTFTFGQTVYGGYFDNKGNLVVTNGFDISTGDISEGWFDASTGGTIRFAKIKSDMQSSASRLELPCNIAGFSMGNENNIIFGVTIGGSNLIYYYPPDTVTDLASLYTFLSNNNLKVVYPLANPITLAITSQDIPTLLGENNIFSNCGDVEVNYYTSKSTDILEFIDSEIGKKNGTNIPIEENSQDSIKDYIDNEVSTINTSLSNKASKTEDTTITLASGYSLISSSCGKTDRLVHLNFNVEKSGGFSTGWQVIGTTDFKPNTLVYCPLWNVTNGLANGEVRIDTDGTINFYIVTAGELRLNANIGYITD